MKEHEEADVDFSELRARQIFRPAPRRLSSLLSDLLALKGYGQSESARQRTDVWKTLVGEQLAADSVPCEVRRGTLTVVVANSMVTTELSLRTQELLSGIQNALPQQNIRKLRFRVGKLD
ncbi:MAG: DUF721 domain-containing protein [Planctomycetes bacterium]|nr:DUF721 domain-containing protein [Planctomycetota bacterium]